MKLQELLAGVDVLECTAAPDTEISQIAYDSRKVTAGTLFTAVTGFAADGNRVRYLKRLISRLFAASPPVENFFTKNSCGNKKRT